jgi:hypothetical protein
MGSERGWGVTEKDRSSLFFLLPAAFVGVKQPDRRVRRLEARAGGGREEEKEIK